MFCACAHIVVTRIHTICSGRHFDLHFNTFSVCPVNFFPLILPIYYINNFSFKFNVLRVQFINFLLRLIFQLVQCDMYARAGRRG